MPGNGYGSGGSAVTRSTLRQQIADALRDEVLAGRLAPGQGFTVKHIADQYGVSTTPVREALVDLSAQGLLESDQHRGFRVHRFTVDDFRTMVRARALVVDGIFRGGSGRPAASFDVRALTSVRRRAEEAARAARAGDLDVLIGYDLRFWRELAEAVGNPYIADFLHRLRVQAWVFAVPRLRPDPRAARWLWGGHEHLVDAATRGDAEAVRAEIRSCDAQALAWADHLDGASRAPSATPATAPPDRAGPGPGDRPGAA
ncbi:GntR family transcriptional regulator [Streptomyces sp. NPDC090029]|uniref:GntR family transcriptional regulator n=1 Tax=Streptomyces sp. NPDC090029 TaxID=3365924 RepID=UPI00382EC6D6